MNKKTYFMFVHGENGKGLWCEFPDLPGCMTDGVDLDDLQKNAADALATWLEGVQDSGVALPESSNVEVLKEKMDSCAVPVLFIVPVTGYLPGAPARINITSRKPKLRKSQHLPKESSVHALN